MRSLTHLQRCSRCILQPLPKPTGLFFFVFLSAISTIIWMHPTQNQSIAFWYFCVESECSIWTRKILLNISTQKVSTFIHFLRKYQFYILRNYNFLSAYFTSPTVLNNRISRGTDTTLWSLIVQLDFFQTHTHTHAHYTYVHVYFPNKATWCDGVD